MHRANSVRRTDESAPTVHNSSANNQTNLFTCSPAADPKSPKMQRSGEPQTGEPVDPAMGALIRSAAAGPPEDGESRRKSSAAGEEQPEQPEQQQQQQSGQQTQQVYMKSCLSDGDFNKIMIKVNDDHLNERAELDSLRSTRFGAADAATCSPTCCCAGASESHCCNTDKNHQRRRSSCSDAEDSRKT